MNRLQMFQFLCQCLAPAAPDSAATQRLAQRLAQEPITWGPVIYLANAHLVAPTLGYALAQKGLFDRLPPEVQDYLTTLRALTRQRNQRLRQQLVTVGAELNALGVEPLLLKGAAGLLRGLYPDATVRLINDLDLAVPAERLDACLAALTAMGYRPRYAAEAFWQQHRHAPPLDHPDWPALVELHRDLVGLRYRSLLDTAEFWRAARPVTVDGVAWRLPSPAHGVLHNFVHTQLKDHNYRYGCVQLRQLYELLLLRQADDAQLDWPVLLATVDSQGAGTALRAYLLLAEKLLGQPLPPGAKAPLTAYRAYYRLLLQTCLPPTATWFICHATRLRDLPLRLVTPSWYPAKYRALTRRWRREASANPP